jgi:hypothetical protein
MNYSDRELLAKTLQAEAGNQGIGGLLDVGSVIMNRVGQSGGSLRDVILKPAQFSAWNSVTGYAGGEQGQDMANMKPDARAYMVADNLLSGDYTDATGGATHYYNPSISNPDWGIKAGGNWAKRGDHVFGRPDGQPKMNIATGGQPMMQPEQKPKGLLGGFFSDPDRRARLAMGLEGMTLNPNQAFMSSLQGGIDKRAAGAEVEKKASKTIEALSRMNTPQAKQALEYLSAGGDPVAALKMAFGTAEGKVRQVTGASLGMTGPSADRLFNVAPDGKITAIGGSAPVTKIITPEAESEWEKGMGKFGVETFSKIQNEASSAQDLLANTVVLENLMADPSFSSGALAEQKMSYAKIIEALGGDAADVGSLEAFRAVTSKLILDSMGGSLGAGFSEGDRKFVEGMGAQLSTSKEGNKMIIDLNRKIASRKLEIASFADNYVKENGMIDQRFMGALREWSKQNPLFKAVDASSYLPEG